MNTSKNTIGAAIAALHSNTPANVPNPFDKTGTVPKLTMAEKKEKDQEARYARQLIETYGYFDTLPVDRREGLVEISIACIEEAERRMEFRLQFQTGIVHLFPSAKAVTWETYKHAARFVRYTFGDHAYKIFREEIRALCAFYEIPMPSAGTGNGSGTKGLTPTKYAQGFTRRVEDLIEFAATVKGMKDRPDAATLREVTAAMQALRTAMLHLNKAVNE